jgi:hypothetical protein
MRNYDDILNEKRPQYPDLPPMSIHDRAAQFSPFAALVGYEDAVEETQRLTDERRIIEEDEIAELNRQLQILEDRLNDRPRIRITYFVPDARKSGGRYQSKVGKVRMIDLYNNTLIFEDKETVRISELYSLVFVDDN